MMMRSVSLVGFSSFKERFHLDLVGGPLVPFCPTLGICFLCVHVFTHVSVCPSGLPSRS